MSSISYKNNVISELFSHKSHTHTHARAHTHTHTRTHTHIYIYIYISSSSSWQFTKLFCFDVAQGRLNGAPNETLTHSCRFASQAC